MRSRLLSAEDAVHRNAWLAEQAEKLQNNVVTVHQGLSLTPSLYFGTRRCTYSDVISIVTTVRIQPAPTVAHASSPSHACGHRGRYDDIDNFNDPLYVNPLQNDRDRDLDNVQRYRKALSSERSVFMSKLQKHRDVRHEVENRAASVIQRMHRGHALRKNLDRLKKMLVIRTKVRVAMKDVTLGTGIILEEKDRTRARLKECTAAATRIQRQFRQLLALAIRRKERKMVREEVLNDCARIIQSYIRQRLAVCYVRKIRLRHYEKLGLQLALHVQRLYRGFVARGALRARRACVERAAIRIIQNAYTRALSTKALLIEAIRSSVGAQDAAVILLQRWARGHASRRRVRRLRVVEKQQIVVAAALVIQRVYRGLLGRRRGANRALWHAEELRLVAAIALTRAARGFMGRRRAAILALEQQVDVFVQARCGNKDAVLDLLDGLGIEAPLDPNSTDHNGAIELWTERGAESDPVGNTVLSVASRFGHLSLVRTLVNRVSLDAANHRGETAIMLAVRHGRADVADYLLTKGPELATTGRTLLHDAARHAMLSTVEQLLLHGLSGTTQDVEWRRTPLHEAVLGGNAGTVQLIVDNCPKATVNYQDKHGATALHYAARVGDLKLVLVLLAAGTDVSLLDARGQTAWRVALTSGHDVVAGEIRKRWSLTDQAEEAEITPGFDDDELTPAQQLAAALEGSMTDLEHLLETGIGINDHDEADSTTMLMQAALRGSITIVKFCIRRGAIVDDTDARGCTALIHASPHRDIAFYLVSVGANVSHQDDRGRTALHEAARHGYTFSEHIAVHKTFLDIKDNSGCALLLVFMRRVLGICRSTPLHEAAKVGSAVGARKLLNLGAHVSCVDLDHRTPIHYATMSASVETLRVLLRVEAAAVHVRDKHGRTAFFDAIVGGHVACAEVLRRAGAVLNEPDPADVTPLHAAIQAQQDASIDYLLSHMPVADWVAGLKGSLDTPLHFACRLGHSSIVDRLLKSGGAVAVTKVNAAGDTPLQTAARCGSVSVLSVFIAHKYDLTIADRETGASLLHLVAEIDTESLDTGVVALLVGAGVPLTGFDKKGCQPLHVASARTKGAGAVRAFLAHGAPVDVPSKANMTPYQCAAQMGIGEIVAILKENGGR
ncbi:hypothetical protein ACHHYP_01157 [Achlya hypogyna]|uniref:Uncharacterized protein n=1 Tax=Achlya hypogyna TaxID=1202772 RepID=A0A1V9ZU94_ACHHY|nr:hypothetical protein ACHHYP_01157 [Achlya hypogyna]